VPVEVLRWSAERWNSADGKKRSFLTVGWNDLCTPDIEMN